MAFDFLKQEIHPSWVPVLKLFYGILLLSIIGFLCVVIGMGHVEQATSYGLDIVLGCLATLAGGFGTWLSSGRKDD